MIESTNIESNPLEQLSPEQKIRVVDTSVFLDEPTAHTLLAAGGNIVVIPIWVILECDKFKKEHSQRGQNARQLVNQLDELSKQGSLQKGIPLPNGGTLLVDHNGKDKNALPFSVSNQEYNNDLKMLTIAQHYRNKYVANEVSLVSNDGVLRVLARAAGLGSEDFHQDAVRVDSIDDLYSGVMEYTLVHPEQVGVVVQSVNRDRMVSAQDVFPENYRPYPNQYCRIQYQTGDALKTLCMLYDSSQDRLLLVPKNRRLHHTDFNAVNELQKVALEFLLNDDISIVSLSGVAGTGKTFLCLMAAMELLQGHYEKVVIFRSNYELGKDMGFLPGSLNEKFEPWRRAIEDNVEFLEHGNGARKLEYSIEPINFVRGRTIHNAFIVVDDAQNLSRREIKALGTRVGKHSKIIFNGDSDQVDTPFLDAFSNGFSCLIDRLKGEPSFAHIRLIENERSKVAGIFAERL